MKLNDITNQRFGRLTVIKRAESKNGRTMWLCKCDCGNYKNISSSSLTRGTTKSCGCYNLEKLSERAKHNMSKTRLYKIWSCMKYRCYGKNHKEFYLYGDRGITVCDDWQEFTGFYKWAKDKYFEGSSIDRIDPNGNYEPSNCRFADKYTQANNKRNNKYYVYKGEKLTISQLSKKYNLNYFALGDRLRKGIDIEKAIETDFLTKNNKITSKEVFQYDLQGNFIKKYPSTAEIERTLGIQSISISKCCRGLQKTAGGYKWKYADE